jgi:hypothetical protein
MIEVEVVGAGVTFNDHYGHLIKKDAVEFLA